MSLSRVLAPLGRAAVFPPPLTGHKISRRHHQVMMKESVPLSKDQGTTSATTRGGLKGQCHLIVESPTLEGKKKPSRLVLNNMGQGETEVVLDTPCRTQHSLEACFGAYLFISHHTWSTLSCMHSGHPSSN